MNWSKFVAASVFAVLSVAALSAHADVQNHSANLEINKVISIVENGGGNCGIVNAQMTYLDSHGVKKVLDYSKFAECGNQGG